MMYKHVLQFHKPQDTDSVLGFDHVVKIYISKIRTFSNWFFQSQKQSRYCAYRYDQQACLHLLDFLVFHHPGVTDSCIRMWAYWSYGTICFMNTDVFFVKQKCSLENLKMKISVNKLYCIVIKIIVLIYYSTLKLSKN